MINHQILTIIIKKCIKVGKENCRFSTQMMNASKLFFFSNSEECFTCDEYTRHVQSIVPGAVAVLGLVSVMVFFESIFICKRRGKDKPLTLLFRMK